MTAPGLVVERAAGRAAADAAAAVLVSAFVDDPGWGASIPSRLDRRLALETTMRAATRHAAGRGTLFVARANDDPAGAAVTWTPDAHPKPWDREYVLAAVTMAARMGPTSVALARRYAAVRRIDSGLGAHWHLAVLGVHPDRQRHRIGTELLGRFLASVDAASAAACLETSRIELVEWYGRFGFEVREHVDPPGSRRIWIMWREPTAPAADRAQAAPLG